MKVLVVNPSLFAPFYDYEFCSALTELGVRVTMVGRPPRSYEEPPKGAFDLAELFYRGMGEHASGWHTSRLGHFRKGIQHAFGLRALERMVVREQVDIVHFQWLVLPFLDRLALRRLKRRCGLVLTVHNSEITTHSPGAVIGNLGAKLQSFGQVGAVHSFDRYVVHTVRTRDQLASLGISLDKIIYKQHPAFDLPTPSKLETANQSDGRRNILFFGQIKPYKGVDILIDAGIELAATRNDFRIIIAGRPFQSLEGLRERIDRAGVQDSFYFDLGYLPETKLVSYLSTAAIVVFPYREIDGSGALSHAVRFGKPIVASNVGGFAESPFREHVELVPPENVGALTSTLASLLNDPDRLAELGRKASELWTILPSWTDLARSCLAAYEQIAPSRG